MSIALVKGGGTFYLVQEVITYNKNDYSTNPLVLYWFCTGGNLFLVILAHVFALDLLTIYCR